MENKSIKETRFDHNPPRPASGTGDVVVPIGDTGQEVILKWEGERLWTFCRAPIIPVNSLCRAEE